MIMRLSIFLFILQLVLVFSVSGKPKLIKGNAKNESARKNENRILNDKKVLYSQNQLGIDEELMPLLKQLENVTVDERRDALINWDKRNKNRLKDQRNLSKEIRQLENKNKTVNDTPVQIPDNASQKEIRLLNLNQSLVNNIQKVYKTHFNSSSKTQRQALDLLQIDNASNIREIRKLTKEVSLEKKSKRENRLDKHQENSAVIPENASYEMVQLISKSEQIRNSIIEYNKNSNNNPQLIKQWHRNNKGLIEEIELLQKQMNNKK